MLHNAIRIGSKKYHEEEPRDHFYDDFMRSAGLAYPDEGIDEQQALRIRRFLNRWNTRYQASPDELRAALLEVQDDFRLLQDMSILDVNFSGSMSGVSIAEVAERVYNTIVGCGRRHEATGTSKILHILQPDLFVMWDERIRLGYASATSGTGYAATFLPRVQMVVRKAVNELVDIYGISKEDAVRVLCPCGHTLAKVLNEYNYAKFTLNLDIVWRAELGTLED
ncbi:MAG: hypothetical protein R6U70_03250 [Bacillota bacterium]